jgi:hypothetical protein
MKRSLAAVLLSLSAAACGSFEDSPPPDGPSEELPNEEPCARGTLESDFQVAGPLAGAGVNSEGKLAPGSYLVSSTYLKRVRTQEAQEQFQQLMGPIVEALQSNPGLVAVQFGMSSSCFTARTLTVWKDEEAMYRFVGSPAHSEAMSRVSEQSRGGSIAISWQDDERGATWEKAVQQLAADTGPFY